MSAFCRLLGCYPTRIEEVLHLVRIGNAATKECGAEGLNARRASPAESPSGCTEEGTRRRLRVLLLSVVFPPLVGGIERLLGGLLARLRTVDITVITPHVHADLDFDDAQTFRIHRVAPRGRIHTVPGKDDRRLMWPMIRSSIVTGLRRPPDVVVLGHSGLLLFSGWVVSRIFRCPYVAWILGTETVRAQRSWRGMLHNAILRRAAFVVVISDYSRRLALEAGVRPRRIAKILPPVDVSQFSLGAKAAARARLALLNRPTLLSVSRIRYYKGHDVVIRALPSIRTQFPDILYLIAGSGPDTPRLEELVSSLGVQAQVRFLGAIPDNELPDLYRSADVFVLPSRESEEYGDVEGFGIVYVEAGACGIPVIGGRSGGVSDAVIDGVTGLLVDPESPAEVSQAITYLLRDSGARARMGRAGRNRAEQELAPETAAQSFEDVLARSARCW
ncbi:MAG: glycosyltransferase family 4 protein [Chloroflexi bacterium]|nr:glycosyltransferase family 4 protein [Chloroflexota bacterium]